MPSQAQMSPRQIQSSGNRSHGNWPGHAGNESWSWSEKKRKAGILQSVDCIQKIPTVTNTETENMEHSNQNLNRKPLLLHHFYRRTLCFRTFFSAGKPKDTRAACQLQFQLKATIFISVSCSWQFEYIYKIQRSSVIKEVTSHPARQALRFLCSHVFQFDHPIHNSLAGRNLWTSWRPSYLGKNVCFNLSRHCHSNLLMDSSANV